MLEVKGLKKSFAGFMAVGGANLTVAKGQTVAVIGPNGAGKSTLFKLITGHHKPDGGKILFKGRDITGQPPHRIVAAGLSLSFQIVNIFHRLTVFENVQAAVLVRQGRGFNVMARADRLAREETYEILRSVGLEASADRVSAALAYGDRKVLEIAIALGAFPEMLIMDEPTAGMSPEETAVTIDLIRRLTAERGLTILFCEHDMDIVFSIADQIMVMHQGRTICQDVCDAVRCHPEVRRAYLGGDNHA